MRRPLLVSVPLWHALIMLSVMLSMLCASCDGPPPAPPQIPDLTPQLKEAQRQSAQAQDELRQERRLRDIARQRYEAETAELASQQTAPQWPLIVSLVAIILSAVVLAIEIRRRRVLGVVLRHLTQHPEDQHH